MMKLNKEYRRVMAEAFAAYNRLVVMEQEDYLECLFKAMEGKDLKTFNRGETDFRDFAIEGYLRNLKNKAEEWQEILNAVRSTRDIVDGIDL